MALSTASCHYVTKLQLLYVNSAGPPVMDTIINLVIYVFNLLDFVLIKQPL